MKRPCRPLSSNLTMPVISANRVSSLPWPTFTPAWCFVPRCRTKIVPALTRWPPNRLTPSRCPCESRPFVEEPPPFLCAMTLSFLRRYFVRSQCGGRCLDRSNPNAESLQFNIANLHGGIVLPVPPRNLILVGLLELQHGNLLVPPVADNLPGHGSFQGVVTRQDLLLVVVHRQNGAKSHLFAHITFNSLNPNGVARRDAILLSPGLND